MSKRTLSTYFRLHRRYYRSVNLERDLGKPDVVLGYVPTERSSDALRRIISTFGKPRAHRAWTLTGVYGTGKSAFAHYLASLCAPAASEVRQEAVVIAQRTFAAASPELQVIYDHLPEQGLLRAVATGQREPLSWTIARALAKGSHLFWQGKRKQPEVMRQLTDWEVEAESGDCHVSNQQVLAALREIVQAAKANVLLIIDELGKNLEFASHHRGTEDLYLLQQIAELQLKGDHQVYFLGLLHQSFAGYSERLATIEQSEWVKIQGRFEDIPFTESPSQMTRLIGQAIDRTDADPLLYVIHDRAQTWFEKLRHVLAENEITAEILANAYPMHPIAALVLPLLCSRYAQNDRSLFTFLTSDEPYAFTQFLASQTVQDDHVPTLKLYQIYDYFVESVTGLASRLNLQRWVEIQGLIQDARDQNEAMLKVLKTIGIFNLVTSTGSLRATPQLVALALCDQANDAKEQKHWQKVIKELQQKGLITYRKQLDELRLWEGSDFNVEAAIYERLQKERSPLAELLSNIRSQKPLVAQRHYATTGTLRYFEQRYVDSMTRLAELRCSTESYDGLIAYWMEPTSPEPPAYTVDGKPLIVVTTNHLELLKVRAQEFQALKAIQKDAPELQADGVARREVKQRLVEAERLLDETLTQAFDWSEEQNHCWVEGEPLDIPHTKAFRAMLSDVCDRVYSQGLVLDNELINRRELTSQGAKARRELIEAILEHPDQERLGLQGYGPEVSMYFSVLEDTGIHRQEAGEWNFYPPHKDSGTWVIWQAIEAFCLKAKNKVQTLDLLYRQLEAPPYGVKHGTIPVLIAAVLSYHFDDVSFYKDSTFIPVLSSEHFELLVKDPSRYGVKHVEVAGLRAQVFRELESVLRGAKTSATSKVRNLTLLSVVKPLFQFIRRLPAYTIKTTRLSSEAQAVLRSLRQAQEPDELIFKTLPEACGLPAIEGSESDDGTVARTLRKRLVQALQEIQNAYEMLLSECQTLLHSAFGVRSEEKLREDLQVRAGQLVDQCIDPLLRRFTLAAVEESTSEHEWLEALVMIVADKPAESWTDEDVTAFEMKLSDLSRRFKNLEALRSEVAASKQGGFEARRVTITRSDGQEIHRMVWFDDEQKDRVECLVEEFLGKLNLYDDPQLQQVLVARLAERVLGVESQGNIAKLQSKQQSRRNAQPEGQTHSRSLRRKG